MFISKQSFYSVDAFNHIKNLDERERCIKVLLPFFYYLISEHQKNQPESGVTTVGGNVGAINFSSFIFIDSFTPCMDGYKNLICLHKEGYNHNFDFSNTLKDLREYLTRHFFRSIQSTLNYSISVGEPLKISVTFKDTPLLTEMNYHINNVMGINVIPHRINNLERKINASKSFKSDECVICLTNPPNVLFCNCGHLCLCVECEEMKSLKVCPVCKTENTIK